MLCYNPPTHPFERGFVTNGYDSLLRRTNLSLLYNGTVLARTTNNFDTGGRLSKVSDGVNSATYSYLANSPLVGQIDFANNGAVRMSTTKQYDALNRLTNIVSSTNAVAVAAFAYAYNSANQRTATTREDGSYWIYTYAAGRAKAHVCEYKSDFCFLLVQRLGFALPLT